MVRRSHKQKVEGKRRWREEKKDNLLENLMKNVVEVNMKLKSENNNATKKYCLKLDSGNCDYMGCNFINEIKGRYGVNSKELKHWENKICLHPKIQNMCDVYEIINQ